MSGRAWKRAPTRSPGSALIRDESRSIHCKDWAPGPDKGYTVLFGEGAADWKGIFAAAESGGGSGILSGRAGRQPILRVRHGEEMPRNLPPPALMMKDPVRRPSLRVINR